MKRRRRRSPPVILVSGDVKGPMLGSVRMPCAICGLKVRVSPAGQESVARGAQVQCVECTDFSETKAVDVPEGSLAEIEREHGLEVRRDVERLLAEFNRKLRHRDDPS